MSYSWKWLIVSVIAAAVLAACSSPPPPAEAPAEEEAPAEGEASGEIAEFCGDPERLSDELNLFNWADYMDPDIMAQFEEACGVTVREDIFSSNEDLIARLQAGNSGYDVVFPSDYAVGLMADAGLLAEIDKANIPNLENIDPNLLSLYFDPGNTYSVPFQWGTTGIAYNTTVFEEPPNSWAYLFDAELVCENSGFVSMLDDERESIGAALIYLGYDLNDTDPEHHEEALALLAAQKECLAGYNSDNFNQTLAAEEVVMAHAWSGGAALALDENEDIAYVLPQEGAVIWMDNFAIPADSANKYTAERFINYVLQADVGAQLTNYTYYFTPNEASEPLLDEYYFTLLEEGGMLVDEEDYARLSWIERNDETIIFSDTWTAVKAR